MKKKDKKTVGKEVVAATLIPSILLSSCSGGSLYFLENDILTINDKTDNDQYRTSVPINFSPSSEDQQLLNFISKLSNDIIENPIIAKEFSENPEKIAQSYNVNNLNLDFNDPLWKLIMGLGDKEISEAILKNDIGAFLALCSDRGLIDEIKKSDLAKYINQLVPADRTPVTRVGVMVAPVAVFVVAVAGCAGAGAAAVVYYETYWWTDGSETRASITQRDTQVYQLWALKQGNEKTHIMLSSYQEKIVNDCIEGLQKYFPEKLEGINMVELKQFISLNMPK